MINLLVITSLIANLSLPYFLPIKHNFEAKTEEIITNEVNNLLEGEVNEQTERLPEIAEAKVKRTVKVPVTAYSSTPNQTDSSPFITASGSTVHFGTVAANFLPFGTKVRFPKIYPDKVFIVLDRMNPRFSRHADIWFSTREEAKQFGRKYLAMEILE